MRVLASTSEGGVRGVWIPQNRTEIGINTAHNDIGKPQTALKLPENFWILQTAWFCKTAIPQLKINIPPNRTKNGAKPHHQKPLHPPHQCGSGSNPSFDAICGLNWLLVSLAQRGFFQVLQFFPLYSKTNYCTVTVQMTPIIPVT